MKGQTAIVVIILVVIGIVALFLFAPGLLRFGVGPAGVGTQGVIISGFTPETSTIDVGPTKLVYTIYVKNIGEQTASGVVAKLVGGLGSDGQPAAKGINGISLAGVDATRGLKGEEASGDWEVTTPASADTDMSYVTTARLTYGYTTVTNVLVRVATQSYVRSITPAGGKTTMSFGIISSKTTGGPFSVTAAARVPTLAGTSGTVRVQFDIQNVGGGRTYKTDPTTDPDIISSVVVTYGTGIQATCSDTTGIRLVQGKSKVLTCDIPVTDLATFQEIPIKLTLAYNYFVDSTTSITVLKSLEGATPAPVTTIVTTPTVTPTGDFTISVDPTSVTFDTTKIIEGKEKNSRSPTITINSIGGFGSTVSLEYSWVDTAPAGTTITTKPISMIPPANGQTSHSFTLTVEPKIAAITRGAYTLRIKGTSGSLYHSTDLTVKID